MKVFLRVLPVFLSFLLLAAHFSRAGSPILVILALGAPFLLLVRAPWAARAVQVALVLGALEWVWTTLAIAGRRAEAGEPWLRMAIILGAVTLFTLYSARLLRSPAVRHVWFEAAEDSGRRVPDDEL